MLKPTDTPSGFDFPCDFPIKIMGYKTDDFEHTILAIIKKHYPNLTEGSLKQRESSQSKYLAFTVTVPAQSKQQLDALYQELTKCPKVLMAL